jgi:hypothetical protein
MQEESPLYQLLLSLRLPELWVFLCLGLPVFCHQEYTVYLMIMVSASSLLWQLGLELWAVYYFSFLGIAFLFLQVFQLFHHLFHHSASPPFLSSDYSLSFDNITLLIHGVTWKKLLIHQHIPEVLSISLLIITTTFETVKHISCIGRKIVAHRV